MERKKTQLSFSSQTGVFIFRVHSLFPEALNNSSYGQYRHLAMYLICIINSLLLATTSNHKYYYLACCREGSLGWGHRVRSPGFNPKYHKINKGES
jgi:hypothetical protein